MNNPPLPIQVDLNVIRDYVHLPTRTIFLEGAISPSSAGFLARALHILDTYPIKPISIYIMTEGGDRAAGLAMYDLIRACKSFVQIIGYGEVCSAGVTVLCAGDERILLSNTRLMIHPGSMSLELDENDQILKRAKEYNKSADKMYYILGQCMGLNVKEMYERYPRETWFSAQQAVKIGLADKVLKTQ